MLIDVIPKIDFTISDVLTSCRKLIAQ